MNKWVAIAVITILAVGLVVGGYFLWRQTSKLGEAESEIVALEGDVSALEGDVLTLEGNVSTLETDLAESEATVSTLETDLAESEETVLDLESDLASANSRISDLQSDVSAQQTINTSLSAELKTVKDPRHFASLSELVDWLHEDDTDTKYADERVSIMSFILQVRALRDGYLLPTDNDVEDGYAYWSNCAIIGDEIYWVYAWNDEIEWVAYFAPIPSHPLPLD